MKILNTTKLFVMNKIATQGIKDPTKEYYKLVVSQDEDAGSISCNKEVYDGVEVGKINVFATEYNEKYESFRVVGLITPVAEKPRQ